MIAKVLVIEDNTDNMALLVYLLESAGHTVIQAVDGMSGVEAAIRDRPDLVLSDVRMPDMDGFEVARRLKSEPSMNTVPLVAVTASASGADRSEALTAGFDHFMSKPIDPGCFLDQILAFLENNRASGAPS